MYRPRPLYSFFTGTTVAFTLAIFYCRNFILYQPRHCFRGLIFMHMIFMWLKYWRPGRHLFEIQQQEQPKENIFQSIRHWIVENIQTLHLSANTPVRHMVGKKLGTTFPSGSKYVHIRCWRKCITDNFYIRKVLMNWTVFVSGEAIACIDICNIYIPISPDVLGNLYNAVPTQTPDEIMDIFYFILKGLRNSERLKWYI